MKRPLVKRPLACEGGSGIRGESGSVLLLLLFTCLAVAVVVQALCAVTLCLQRAAHDEAMGRTRLSERDHTLASIRAALLHSWAFIVPSQWRAEDGAGGLSQGGAEEVAELDGWLMKATVSHDPTQSRAVVSVLAERGRDGMDLPMAAVVAGNMTAAAGRKTCWLELADGGEGGDGIAPSGDAAHCYLAQPPTEPLFEPGCVLHPLESPWRLDPGWAAFAPAEGHAQSGAGVVSPGVSHVAAGERTLWLRGDSGQTVTLPFSELTAGWSAAEPLLAVLVGGADLDARGLGALHGVLVVDGGSALLEGTVLHGAVFATDEVALGETGQVVFSRKTLRWATDQSLHRVRLVPGTRWEGFE